FDGAAVLKHDALEFAVPSFQPGDSALAHLDAVPGQSPAHRWTEPTLPIGAQHDVGGPDRKPEGQSRARLSPAIDSDRPVTPLPGVAVGAVVHAQAIELRQSRNGGKVVHH